MKCIKCTTKNINSANYCKKCGNKFLEAEQKSAKRWSLVWFLERIDDIKSLWKFSFITDHIAFKIGSILAVLAVGVYSIITNGSNLKILESDDYQIQYNAKLSEYYLLVENSEAELNLYIPKKTEKLTVEHFDKDNKLLGEQTYNEEDNIVLVSNTIEEDYYIIKTMYDENESESLKIYIYREDGE